MLNKKRNFLIVFLLCSISLNASNIYLNKAGYLLNSTKIVYFRTFTDSFFVKDAANKLILKDKVEISRMNDPSTGMTIYKGNFSAVNQAGYYYVTDKSGNRSSMFFIADTVYNSVYKKSLKGFYYQRCGSPLLSQHAGVYQHTSCHSVRLPFYSGDGEFHISADTTGHSNVTGGWHDAGDYGKYVVNAGITVGTLLMAYEMFPERFFYDDLNIPESGNTTPDILDECRYELNWLFKMQRPNGAVFTKVTHETFEGFIMPQFDNTTRYIYQIASTATADFAAMMARAYRVFKKYDQPYSEKCLAAAKKAWDYLESHPSIFPAGGFRNPAGTITGEYGDANDTDERLWASAELFISAGESKYHSFYLSNYKRNGLFTGSMAWPSMAPMAQLTYVFGSSTQKDQTVLAEHKVALQNYCNTLVTRSKNDGFNVTLQSSEYYWGSNSDVLNRAILLIAGYELYKSADYYDAALSQFNYILGANANDISYITGIGEKRVMHPHHRPSGSDGIVEPVPGLMAGGPDKGRDDDSLRAYTTSLTPSALCYIDNEGSYSSNEICINWNAPLVFVAGYFNNGSLIVDVKKDFEKIPTELHLDQNYPNPFNPETVIGYRLSTGSHVSLKVLDVLGREVATLVDEYQIPGFYNSTFDTLHFTLSSGVYLYTLRVGENIQTKKMILIK
ncbi:MAG: glycoside hydrolase family 9 protein [Ignavibacteriales bacterium]|nr:glycoside hydrolase family 9 protein [Ignavibacteriales bacterium]